MTFHSDERTPTNWIATGVAVGLAGGLAEVLVVGAYSAVAGVDAAGVASAIASAARIDPVSAASGLAVHMALSAGLGVVLLVGAKASGCLRAGSALRTYLMALLTLGLVWILNFFVILPILSPAFVHLLPLPVTLASKLMFAVAAAATLRGLSADAASRPVLAHLSGRASG